MGLVSIDTQPIRMLLSICQLKRVLTGLARLSEACGLCRELPWLSPAIAGLRSSASLSGRRCGVGPVSDSGVQGAQKVVLSGRV